MIEFVELTPDLLNQLEVADCLKTAGTLMGSQEAIAYAAAPGQGLAMIEDGRVIGAAGVIPVWEGRGLCWFIPGLRMTRRHYGRALRRCQQQLAHLTQAGFRRLDCTVGVNHAAGRRWAARIGFVVEGTLTEYAPDGSDQLMLKWERSNVGI
jgi:RimJ/RimL family protein N-acetyltransferase